MLGNLNLPSPTQLEQRYVPPLPGQETAAF